MTTTPAETLHTYRCQCGKLLFKGLLMDSTVQIKCKRCGTLMSFQETPDPAAASNRYAFVLNRRGEVVSASSNIQKLLGHDLANLLTMSHDKLSPTTTSENGLRISLDQMWSLRHKEWFFFKSKTVYQNKNGELVTGVTQSKFVKTPEDTYLLNVFYANTTLANVPVEPEFLQLYEYPFFLQVDLDGICTYAHSERRPPYSRATNEIVGQSYASFLLMTDAERQEFSENLKRGKPFELLNTKYRRGNGLIIQMDAFFAPNVNAGGKVTDYTVYVFNAELLADYEKYLVQNFRTNKSQA